MRKEAAMLMLFALLSGGYLLRESQQAPLREVDAFFVDWLAGNTRLNEDPAPVLLVEIDDDSLANGDRGENGDKHGWPWPPLDYALFLQAIGNFEPPVISIQPVLAWNTISNESEQKRLEHQQYARLLHNALLRAPKVLLGARLGYTDDPTQPQPHQQVPTIRRVNGNRQHILEYTAVEGLPDEAYRLSPVLGFTNVPDNSVVRRVPLVFRYRGEVVPSFVLQALMLWFQLTPDDIEVVPGSHVALGPRVRIPIDDQGAMRLDFRMPYHRVPYADLLLLVQQIQSKAHASADTKAAAFHGKLALLGRTDKESRKLELGNSQFGAPAQVFATAIAMVQNQRFLQQLPAQANFGFILIAMGLGPILLRRSRAGVLGFSVIAGSAYLLISLWLFSATAVALPLLLPMGLLAFVGSFAFFVR